MAEIFLAEILALLLPGKAIKELKKEMQVLRELFIFPTYLPPDFSLRRLPWLEIEGTYSHVLKSRVVNIMRLMTMMRPSDIKRARIMLTRFIRETERYKLNSEAKQVTRYLRQYYAECFRKQRRGSHAVKPAPTHTKTATA